MYEYTVHVPDTFLEQKVGGVILRRGTVAFDLASYLFKTGEIVKITSAAMDELLLSLGVRMPKNATKGAKVRRMMTCDVIASKLDRAVLDAVEAKLKEIEAQRKSKNKDDEGPHGPDEGDEDCQ